MEIKLTLALPRDALSVPVVRQVCSRAMRVLGIEASCISDLEVALTEACANVLNHARDEDDYEVSAGILDDRCVIEVRDRGLGYDGTAPGASTEGQLAERGRGVALMRSLVDSVHFQARPERGTVVHLEKTLRWAEDSPMARLVEGRLPSEHSSWSADRGMTDIPRPLPEGTAAVTP